MLNFAAMNDKIDYTASAKEKWGTIIDGGYTGFQLLPDVLLRGQTSLNLTDTDIVLILNILMHWWKKEELPYPRPEMIAKRMGITTRTVERHINKLQAMGLLHRLPREANPNGGPKIRRFDLSGLLDALEDQANQFRGWEAMALSKSAVSGG